MKHIVPITLRSDGLLLRTVNRWYALPDGRYSIQASGAALKSGIGLNNQFIGTGYHEKLLLWGDFGSHMYVINLCNK